MERRIEKLEERVRFIDRMLFAGIALAAALGVGGSFVWKSYTHIQAKISELNSELETTKAELEAAKENANNLLEVLKHENDIIDRAINEAAAEVIEKASKNTPTEARAAISEQLVGKIVRDALSGGVDSITAKVLEVGEVRAQK